MEENRAQTGQLSSADQLWDLGMRSSQFMFWALNPQFQCVRWSSLSVKIWWSGFLVLSICRLCLGLLWCQVLWKCVWGFAPEPGHLPPMWERGKLWWPCYRWTKGNYKELPWVHTGKQIPCASARRGTQLSIASPPVLTGRWSTWYHKKPLLHTGSTNHFASWKKVEQISFCSLFS